jgi:hypothetical protein
MNKRMENKLTMYEGVNALFQSNAATVDAIPTLKESVVRFNTTLASIPLKASEVNNASTGKAAVKNQLEDELVTLLLPIAAALYIFAKKQNDVELMEKVRITESGLRKYRDTDLANRAATIATFAESNNKNLVSAGITDAMITALNDKAQEYLTAVGARESSVAERMGARTSMEDLFYSIDDMLEEEIDPAMELIRGTNTQFYNGYFALRVVKDTGVRHKPQVQPAPTPVTQPSKAK